jgi:ribosomal protein S18 acetylase RimI-like enzyme
MPRMNFEIVPAGELALAEQARIFNLAFTGYLAGWSEMNAAALVRFLCAQGADLCHSRFLREKKGECISFGYINRTGNIARLASMGTVPRARRSGAAAYLLSQLMDEAKARADEAMILEVFEQNPAAITLYRRHGFRELTRLFGWRRRAEAESESEISIKLREISLLAASHAPGAYQYPRIPWQISQYAMAKLAVGRAYKIDNVHVVIGDPDLDSIRVQGLFWNDENGWHAPRKALAAVLRRFPKREFVAPAIFPAQFGTEIFERLGFTRESLNQFLMRRDL